MKKKSIFTTTDLTLATVISLYQPIISYDRTNPKQVRFLFSQSSDLQSLIERFGQDKILVEPKKFASQQKNLKSLIYNYEHK